MSINPFSSYNERAPGGVTHNSSRDTGHLAVETLVDIRTRPELSHLKESVGGTAVAASAVPELTAAAAGSEAAHLAEISASLVQTMLGETVRPGNLGYL